jgi:hypothetical protein
MIADGSHVPESRVAEEQPHAHVAHGAIVLLKNAAENREKFHSGWLSALKLL